MTNTWYPSGCIAILLSLCAGVVLAAPPESASKVDEGNSAYAAGDYETALNAYAEAEVGCPECPELAYDRGLVYYRMRDFAKAREMFNASLATRDLGLEARAKYNLGIVSYVQALEKLNAPQEAIEHARQAIYHYRDTLDLEPEDADARANIEIAQLLIKDLLDKLKQQQEEQQQDQQCDNPQQDQQQQDQQQQDQQQQDQQQENEQQQGEQDEQQQEQDGQSGEEQEQQEEQQQDPQSGQQQDEQPPQTEEQQTQGERREMTEEELERALQAVRDREAQRRAERARRQNARRAPVTRDW